MEMEEPENALADVSEEAVDELISVVADALSSATGIDIGVEGGEEEGMEGEEGMDFAPAVGEEGEEEEEMALEEIDMIDEDAVMQETYRRVTKRLSGMNKEHKLVESVTAKVLSRLHK